jgi:putative peptide zinc metalloprotease protein
MMSFMNPLAIRFNLIDPNEFLNATYPLIRPLFSWVGALLYLAFVAYATVLAGMNWDALTENVTDRVLSAENIILMVLCYPAIKALHELGHAYAVKRWGGDVHEIGIMMLVFMPVPYVDASDSAAFPGKWQRALVGAAGILVEVFLASLALIVWLNADDGFVRAFAFNVMLIGGVSTLFFNGNPLLRFDGYYVLSDILEIPNLGSRANKYLGYWIKKKAFGIRSATSPATAPGEPFWFVTYAIAAFCYRLVIMATIALFVSQKFFIVGTLIAIWSVILMIGVPLAKQTWFLLTSPQLRKNRGRAFAVVGGVFACAGMVLFAIPVPYSTVAEGVVWLPGKGVVHAQADGTVLELLAEPGQQVEAGTALMRLEDPLLSGRVTLLKLRIRELEHRLDKQDLGDQANALIVREELQLARADLLNAEIRERALVVKAESDGTLIVPGAKDLVGRFVRRGQKVAYIAQFLDPPIRVIVPENSADLVRNDSRKIDVRFIENPRVEYHARIAREVPALSDTLPSAALSTMGGGNIALDPSNVEANRTLEKLLQIDVLLAENQIASRVGSRVFVKFYHGNQPLAGRLYRMSRQVFLKLFKI